MTKVWDILDPELKAVLAVDEEEIEILQIDMGIHRYRTERLSSDKSHGWPEQKMIGKALDTLVPAIYKVQKDVAAGKPAAGVRYWGVPILTLPADKLAFIILSTVVNQANLGDHSRIANISRLIGTGCKIEREFSLIKSDAPDVYRFMRKHSKNWTKRTHRTAKAKAKNVDTGWTPRITHWLGMVLLQLALEHTGMFTLNRFVLQGKTEVRISLTRDTYETIEAAHSECELLRPFHLPMVVPPVTWEDGKGGYLFQPLNLVKPNLSGDWKASRSEVDMPRVVKAVNNLQATEWRINRRVLPVVKQLWAVGGGWASLPTSEPLPVPPPEFDWGSASDTEKKEWKIQATRIHDENARLGSKRKSIIHKLWIAAKLSTRDVIYFPWQLDWRGRAYPVPSHLHPQSDDVGRSLLEFASDCELGERGQHWLRIHLANCYRHEKDSFSGHAEWVRSNWSHIEQSANNPFDYRWWSLAKKPWLSLAACFELAEAGPTYGSHLPVQVDGSCNGLQHFSAMGRDAFGGKLVNLLPGDEPESVYEVIADEVNKLIERDVRKKGWWRTPTDKLEGVTYTEVAQRWLGNVTPDTVKRPAMTIVYGLTFAGMMKQYLADGACDGLSGSVIDNTAYLRDVTWEALDGALTGAASIMDWLRSVAAIASEHGNALRWETPIGFPVIQEYLKQKETHIYTALQKLTLREPNREKGINVTRQIRGLPPNFVHSMDASHMMTTILNCAERGITDFSMIHDSFGVHAAKVDDLNAALREEFVNMYSGNILVDMHQHWQQDMGIDLPPPPPQGTLRLEEILQSSYMFG